MPKILSPHGSFPDRLFLLSDRSKRSAPSPDAALEVAAAFSGEGEAWANLTAPSQEPEKKKIIIDSSTFASCHPYLLKSAIPLISKLKSAGFEVFLFVKEGESKNFYRAEDSKEWPGKLEKLTEFKGDYALLDTEHKIARDAAVLLDEELRREVRSLLDKRVLEQPMLDSSDFHTDWFIHYSDLGATFRSVPTTITTIEELCDAMRCFPSRADYLYSKHIHLITTGIEFAAVIKVAPPMIREEMGFYSVYASLTKNASDLANLLEAAPQQFTLQILGWHKDLIKSEEEFVKCFEAAPHIGRELLRDYGHLIKSKEGLMDCFKAAPDLEEEIFRGRESLFVTGGMSADTGRAIITAVSRMNAAREKISLGAGAGDIFASVLIGITGSSYIGFATTDDVFTECADRVNDSTQLANCFKAPPQYAQRIYDKWKRLIVNSDDLANVLKAPLPPELAQKIVLEHQGLINNGELLVVCLKAAPKIAAKILKGREGLIKDGWQVASSIKAVPENIDKILAEGRADLIDDVWKLADCLKAAPEHITKIYKGREHLIKNGNDLAICIEAAPEQAAILLEAHGKKIDYDSYERILRVIKPEIVDRFFFGEKSLFRRMHKLHSRDQEIVPHSEENTSPHELNVEELNEKTISLIREARAQLTNVTSLCGLALRIPTA